MRDLIELNGEDLRREPLGIRKNSLAQVLARAGTWAAHQSLWCPSVCGRPGPRVVGA
jgi:ATP-dependent DNA ligase